ncbi:hypothetical protein AC622_08455 [Bacillus sp. FJAT-27916]|uniref:DUF4870 domain-containing protein n=1 Tax=Bacillaceae TaxID=186817 RepID=UPI000670E86F|nr:DUF4870 domain-containing protein [Bacillus sp. FJAT-27916]KMY44278.1 hypothetical protein AC622_08455 [Bacillus sp. FJAT-27916]
MVHSNDKIWAGAVYLSSFVFVLFGPLVIWLLKRNDSEFVNYHCKEYFNFLISYTIYTLIAFILVFVGIGIILAWVLSAYVLIFTIIAAVKAFSGEYYQIPLIIRFIK